MKDFNDIRSHIIGITVKAELDIEKCADLYRSSEMAYKMYSDTQDYLAGIFDMAKFIVEDENTLNDCELIRLEQFTYSSLRCAVNNVIVKYKCK